MAPNNNIPTIQLTEVPIPISAVSEIDDTLKTFCWWLIYLKERRTIAEVEHKISSHFKKKNNFLL